MTTKPRAPLVKELYFTEEEKKEVERIQSSEHITKRKDRLRSVVGGPMCCICHSIPTKRIEYNLDGVIRIETYCDEHFSIFERNQDVDINDIIEAYNCQRAPEGTFGGSKVEKQKEKEGYSLTPKSSLADRTIICNRCRVTRIFFDEHKEVTITCLFL